MVPSIQIDEETYLPVAQITSFTFTPKDVDVRSRAQIYTVDGHEHHIYDQEVADALRRLVNGAAIKYIKI